MTEQQHPTRTDDGRSETPTERMDRNWNELLQELRVAQTGVQILTGFLLTVPFQQRFTDLDEYQKDVYLVLVVLAVAATGFIVAPVSLHRILFRRHLKRELVESADKMAQTGLAMLALVLAGSALLLFDVVVGRTAGWVAGTLVIAGLAAVWLAVPLRLSRNAHRDAD
jgi:O-antigen/teichoic acid export membrane protein